MHSQLPKNLYARIVASLSTVLMVATAPLMAQAVRQDTTLDTATTSTAPVVAQNNSAMADDIIMMSPFQVDSTKEKGYFAENTLAGSRMRTNVADLGAAISVVTKQQMEDTASLDMNDIFRYEIGTEGAGTYTPDTMNSSRPDGVMDVISGGNVGGAVTASTNSTANRVRGLGSPSIAINYYQALTQIPFDSYNTASVEINRGPNSLLFGMGSPAGIVNQSTAQALINKNNAQISFRVDDRGSARASFNFNKSLVKDKLAIYGAFLYNDQQFERKPSYDITRRQYGAITYRPFKRTTIRASIEGYSNDNRRPNSLSPIDGISEWQAAGMPIYDALNKTVISAATGKVLGMYAYSASSPNAQQVRDYVKSLPNYNAANWKNANGTADPTQTNYNGVSIFGTAAMTNVNSILYVPGITTHATRTVMQIADGQLQNWFQPLGGNNPVIGWNGTSSINAISTSASASNYVYGNSTWANVYDWYQTESKPWSLDYNASGPYPAYYGTYKTYKGVTDKSIYNWSKTNVSQMNFGNQRNTNYNIELEQEIVPELLHFSAGWFRQDFDSEQSYTVGQLNATALYVDTNMYLSDGSPNPFLGRPYVYDQEPERFVDSTGVDQYRAMLAFTPDFTKNKGWTKWLGRHQIMGMGSYMDSERTTFRKRLVYFDGEQEGIYRYMANRNSAGWNRQTTGNRRYFYLSDGGTYVNRASGTYDDDYASGQITVYDYANSQFKDIDMTMFWNIWDGAEKTQRQLTSYAVGWNGYLWNDRIITTVGVRRDINKTRGTTNGATTDYPTAMTNAEKWVDGYYQYDEVFKRWKDWFRMAGTTKTYGAVIKPFLHWEPIASRSGDNLWWEFVENLGFSYNRSDNFDAPAQTQVDLFGTPLPKPVGNGKDYGVQFSLFKNKLFARVNWFDSTNENVRNVGALQRLYWHMDTTGYRGWLETIYMLNDGGDPSQDKWSNPWTAGASGAVQSKVDAMKAKVAQWWGLNNDYDYYDHLSSKSGTRTVTAKGVEVSINYNPLPNWTIKFTGSKNESSYDKTTQEFDAWYNKRWPVWQDAVATTFLNSTGLATLNSLGGIDSFSLYNTTKKGNIKNYMSSTNYNSTITSDSTSGWFTPYDYYLNVVDSVYIVDRDLQGAQVMGQRKYNATLVTNYAIDRGTLKGWSVGGAQRWSSKAIIGYYGRASGNNKDSKGNALLDSTDVSRPIYDGDEWHTDLWVAYTRKILNDKVRMKLQLNVADVFEDGGLKAIRADWRGQAYSYRIVDSRQFILSATFDF